jgi:hypothetical protein
MKKKFIVLGDRILTTKKSNPKADTSQLETGIDHLAYKLYNLTWGETKIINPDFEPTSEKYTLITI